MYWQQLANSLSKKIQGEILVQEPMKNHTTWRIGGPADILVVPNSIQDVVTAITEARQLQVPITIMGNGSNSLVKDGGIRGLVLKINRGLNKYKVYDNVIEAEAGIMLPRLARIAAQHHLTGLEFAIGIPAALGGAIAMNAGAVGGEMSNYLEKVSWVDQGGKIHYTEKNELEFAYRKSAFPQKEIVIVKAWLKFKFGDPDMINQLTAQFLTKRKKSQPISLPNAGSVFKNPAGKYAGKLIEQAGLKGTRVGDAQVSEIHGNFMVNLDKATANNMLILINLVRNRVWEQFNVNLDLEVKVLGEDLPS